MIFNLLCRCFVVFRFTQWRNLIRISIHFYSILLSQLFLPMQLHIYHMYVSWSNKNSTKHIGWWLWCCLPFRRCLSVIIVKELSHQSFMVNMQKTLFYLGKKKFKILISRLMPFITVSAFWRYNIFIWILVVWVVVILVFFSVRPKDQIAFNLDRIKKIKHLVSWKATLLLMLNPECFLYFREKPKKQRNQKKVAVLMKRWINRKKHQQDCWVVLIKLLKKKWDKLTKP